jgi:hypothetical protein
MAELPRTAQDCSQWAALQDQTYGRTPAMRKVSSFDQITQNLNRYIGIDPYNRHCPLDW